MRKHTAVITAAALTLGGLSYVGVNHAWADDNRTTGQKAEDAANSAGDAIERGADQAGAAAKGAINDLASPATQPGGNVQLPAGITPKNLNEQDDVRKELAKVINNSVDKGNFKDVVDQFAKSDRDRLTSFAKSENFDKYDGSIDQFRKDWKAKYGKDFDLDGKNVLTDQFATIMEGEISNPAMLSNWPVSPTGGQQAPPEHSTKDNANTDKGMPEKDLSQGRNVAVVHIPASHGLPALNVSMLHEATGWAIDIPDNIDGKTLKDNLQKQLYSFGSDKANWPADVNEAYRELSHHMLMAIYGVERNAGGMENMNTGGNTGNTGGTNR